jgi:hypothetical protein
LRERHFQRRFPIERARVAKRYSHACLGNARYARVVFATVAIEDDERIAGCKAQYMDEVVRSFRRQLQSSIAP